MKVSTNRQWFGIIVVCFVSWGCAAYRNQPATAQRDPASGVIAAQKQGDEQDSSSRSGVPKLGWAQRRVTDQELLKIGLADPSLSPVACREILARLNNRAPYYISEDIRKQRPLRVPNDFAAYKDWSPLPRHAPEISHVSKVILVTLDFPFLGWYENGKLLGDTHICVGKQGELTEAGIYRIEEKDADHYSRSYQNSYGQPAWMPWALRIYDHVWIHAGDITGANCSHGCVILPLEPAQEIFHWADPSTVVLIVQSLADLERIPEKLSRRLAH